MNDAPLPNVLVSPTPGRAAFLFPRAHVTRDDRHARSVGVGPLHIGTRTRAPRHAQRYARIEITDLESGRQQNVLHGRPRQAWPIGFSSDGECFACAHDTRRGVRMFWADCESGRTDEWPWPVNAAVTVFDEPPGCWVGSTRMLAMFLEPQDRGASRRATKFDCPEVEDTSLDAARLLPSASASDALPRAVRLLTSQIGLVETARKHVRRIGPPGLYRRISASPDGRYLLVSVVIPATDRRRSSSNFPSWPSCTEVWDLRAPRDTPAVVARSTPYTVGGERYYGKPMEWYWHPLEPATVTWLDDRSEERPGVFVLRPPFSQRPGLLYRVDGQGLQFAWTTSGRLVVVEWNREASRTRVVVAGDNHRPTIAVSTASTSSGSETGLRDAWASAIEYSSDERRPVSAAYGKHDGLLVQRGDLLYLTGSRHNLHETQAFIETLDLRSQISHRVYVSEQGVHERVIGFGDSNCSTVVTIAESGSSPPHYALACGSHARRAIHSRPRLPGRWSSLDRRTIEITGTPRGTRVLDIFLPPARSSRPAPVPILLWIQPRLYTAAAKPFPRNRYPDFGDPSPLAAVLSGIGVVYHPPLALDPIRIDVPGRMWDQLADQVKSAIDALVEAGVADRDHIGIGGHCVGAYATVALLSRTNLFRAGVASAGRYNLASLPLGAAFAGLRSFHEAPAVYVERSPLTYAKSIETPLLLIHGELDDFVSPGESDDLYKAIAKAGGQCRYVRVPHEGHIFRTRDGCRVFETELANWCTRHLAATDARRSCA
ncbi:MAG TPA: prolyl oligopeptidase family serine peptidase [Vicinamibacterales bacterium]|nr:prolyl oligopeptidase family serine peptidase [Vicinamibacterales bacterium]